MSIKALLTAAAAGAALTVAGAAYAGDPTYQDKPQIPAASPTTSTPVDTPAPSDTAATPPAANVTVTADAPQAAPMRLEIITNGPVPDTPQNRARYGQPDSNAGKHTTPAGN